MVQQCFYHRRYSSTLRVITHPPIQSIRPTSLMGFLQPFPPSKVSTANSGHLSAAERRKNDLILTLLLGKRDLLQSFLSIYVHSSNDFNWEKLLKYVWSLETGTVQVTSYFSPTSETFFLYSLILIHLLPLRLSSASASSTMDMSLWEWKGLEYRILKAKR